MPTKRTGRPPGEGRVIPFRPQPEKAGNVCPRCDSVNTYTDTRRVKIEVGNGLFREYDERVYDCFDCWHVWR